MAKNHIQPGIVIAVTLAASHSSGDLIAVGELAGVCLASGGSGDEISVQIDEVFEVAKLSTDVMGQGVTVYLDAANKRVTLDDGTGANIYAGKTTAAAGNGAATVALKLNA